MSKHSWQGHFGPDVTSRTWPEFLDIVQVVPVAGSDARVTLAGWPGPHAIASSGVVAGDFARSKAVGRVLGGRPVGPPLTFRPFLKLVTYVPRNAVDRVRAALVAAGAGSVGSYTHVTFAAAGTSSFKAETVGNSRGGRGGRVEFHDEAALSLVLPTWLEDEVLGALARSHPYPDAAYDLMPLANRLLVPQAYLGDDGIVRTAFVSEELASWAVNTGVARIEAERTDGDSRLEMAQRGIAVSLVPLGTWTVPGLESILEEVRPRADA
jgi:hypothetical protein